MPIFGKKSEAYLGVDFGAGGIKVVELRKAKGRPQLWTYGLSSLELDIHLKEKKGLSNEIEKKSTQIRGNERFGEAGIDESQVLDDPRIDLYADYLKQVLEAAQVTTRIATASLPVSHVFHAVVTLPRVEDKEIDYHVRAKIKKMLPRPIEEMQVVHQLVDTENEKVKSDYIKLLVTAAPKQLVTFYTAIFQRAGLELHALETEAFALERSLVGHDMSTSMVVDIGAERTNFFIIDNGLPLTHRSIELGGNNFDAVIAQELGVGQDLVGQVKQDISRLPSKNIPLELFLPLIEPITKEIQYSFDLFLRQTGNEDKRPEKIVLTGGSSLFPPISSYVAQNFSMKTFVGDPWARVVYQQGLKPVLDAIGPRMSVCIGLALRTILQ